MVNFVFSLCVLFFVYIQNGDSAAPKQTGLPISINVGEFEYVNRKIHCLDVTDVNTDSFVCNTDVQTTALTDKFRVLKDPDTGKFCVYTHNSNPGTPGSPNFLFDYATNKSFEVYTRCTDVNNEFSLSLLEVDVISKDRVEFNNLPNSVTLDALNTAEGVLVYTVQSTDLVDNQFITYYMTTLPATSSFSLNSGTGQIRTALPLKHENNNPIDLFVKACDGLICIEEKLRVDLTNTNSIPKMTNLPETVSVLETVASGSLVFTITTTDDDALDTLTYSLSVVPSQGTNLFSLDTTTVKSPKLKLATGKKFDYEQNVKSYNVSITVDDTKTTTTSYVIVTILDAEEPCYFDRAVYIISMQEAGAGTFPANPGFVVKDYDGTSTHSFSFVSNPETNKFTINSASGVINFKVGYDIDGGAMPSIVTLPVICTDPTSLTGTATVTAIITDINDNDPTFSLGSYSFIVGPSTVAGSLIGTLAVTDADSGSNAEVTCSSPSANNLLSTRYFNVGTNCGVYLISTTGLVDKQTISYTVLAEDKGTPARTGTTFVHLEYSVPTTTTPTTTTTTAATTTADPLTEPGTIAAICVGTIIGAILLGVLLYFCLRWCYTGNCCGPQPCDFTNCCTNNSNGQNYTRRQITPQDSKPQKESPRDTRDSRRERHPSRERDDYKYRREDTDYDNNRSYNDSRNYAPRSAGRRGYSPFPKAVTPSDVPMEIDSQGRKVIGYIPRSGYYR